MPRPFRDPPTDRAALLGYFDLSCWADRRGVSMSRKPHNVPPKRKNRPTKVALREMAKIRKVLGLPRLPEPI